MKALTFTLELLEPMISTGLAGEPNTEVSLPFVAGSVLRGVVIGLFLRSENKPELDLSEQTENDLFFNGKTRFLNAYPQIGGRRSFPVPLSWHKKKETEEKSGESFYDFCLTKADKEDPKKETTFKNLGSPFFINNEGKIIVAKPETRLAVHTNREPKKGRSTTDEGAVFRYESIVAGTKFGGAIIGEEDLLEKIKILIENKKVFLGGSRTAGYGKARIIDAKIEEDWNETENGVAIKKDENFTVTLLSNALIRDANGQLQTEIISVFDESDNKKLEIASIFDNCSFEDYAEIFVEETDKPTGIFKRAELVGGFNRKWGLPLPQQISVKAGSVFSFKAKKDIDSDTLQKWLDDGIGERRVDGFGRIGVNLNKTDELHFADAEQNKLSPKNLNGQNGGAKKLGEKLVERILRQNFQKAITGIAGGVTVRGKISNSQISRLRMVIREVLRGANAAKIPSFFDDLRKTARDQFGGVKIDGVKIETWIADAVNQKNKINNVNSPKIGGLEITGDQLKKLQAEYHLHLIDGILARMAKEKGNE